jgi:hypothetical protein
VAGNATLGPLATHRSHLDLDGQASRVLARGLRIVGPNGTHDHVDDRAEALQ